MKSTLLASTLLVVPVTAVNLDLTRPSKVSESEILEAFKEVDPADCTLALRPFDASKTYPGCSMDQYYNYCMEAVGVCTVEFCTSGGEEACKNECLAGEELVKSFDPKEILNILDVFGSIDMVKDGKVSPEEAMEYFNIEVAEANDEIGIRDLNCDGMVDLWEIFQFEAKNPEPSRGPTGGGTGSAEEQNKGSRNRNKGRNRLKKTGKGGKINPDGGAAAWRPYEDGVVDENDYVLDTDTIKDKIGEQLKEGNPEPDFGGFGEESQDIGELGASNVVVGSEEFVDEEGNVISGGFGASNVVVGTEDVA